MVAWAVENIALFYEPGTSYDSVAQLKYTRICVCACEWARICGPEWEAVAGEQGGGMKACY